ncbi:acyltransferase family protein [Arthrobacter burdickii]|uniref:Acyltransferase n=1 Tax=Arthrobacter burdickii TaxID=3035920 RepID=A0ABT8K3E2_9MICC|nr:acyltransferase [Arthrobacter burdickii]MDN4611966.1 acyltransferase [Arthrobacter burdickii]
MDSTTAKPVNLRSLTGLRFYAAFIVVIYHVWRIYDGAAWIGPLAGYGYTGVTFFFILSGFVLCWSHKPGITTGAFYWHRFARVWPLHALTTLFAIILGLAAGTTLSWKSLPFVLTLTHAWLPGEDRFAFNGPSWSLSNEMFFYALFPLIFLLLAKQGKPLVWAGVTFTATALVGLAAMGVILRYSPGNIGFALYTMPAFRLAEFIMGICLALAMQRGWRPRFGLHHAVAAAITVYALLAVTTGLHSGNPLELPNFVGNLVMGVPFAMIITAGAAGDLRGNGGLVRSPLMLKLGSWSFALYLIHELVLRATEPLADTLSAVPTVLLAIAAVALSILIAGGLYNYFERPVEKQLRARLKNRSGVTQSA